MTPKIDDTFTEEQVAVMLHKSVRTLARFRKAGKINYIKNGGSVLYRPSDIQGYYDRCTITGSSSSGTPPTGISSGEKMERDAAQSTGTSHKGAARDFLQTWILADTTQPIKDCTVTEALEVYYHEHASKKASEEAARYAKKNLAAFFGTTLVSQCDAAKQKAYKDFRLAAGKKPGYINRELSVLSAALNYVVDYKGVDNAPRVKFLPTPPEKDRYLERDELAKLMWRLRQLPAAQHLLLFIRLGVYSGPRPHEITGLRWAEDIDFERRAIWYYDPDDTTKSASVVHMSPAIYNMLKAAKRKAERKAERLSDRYGEHVKPSAYVISHRAGEPVDRVIQALKRHADACGIRGLTPHVLRHTFATWAVRGGASINDVSRTLGHKRISTTQRYAKHTPEAHKDTIEAARRTRKKR